MLRHGIRRKKRYTPYWTRDVLANTGKDDRTPAALQGRLLGQGGTFGPQGVPLSATGLLAPRKGDQMVSTTGVLLKKKRDLLLT
jgi:hypothetical protein